MITQLCMLKSELCSWSTDLFNLLVRSAYISYVCRWKSLLIQFLMVVLIAIPFSRSINEDMTKPDSCVSSDNGTNSSQTCLESMDRLYSESLISQNIKYHLVFMTAVTYLQLVVTPLTFATDVNIFLNQHSNGEQ